MLKLKRLACLSCFILLLETYDMSTITPFNALATDVVENNTIKIKHEDNIEFNKNTIEEMKDEKMIQKKLIKEKEVKDNEPEWKEFILTFYTSLESENSKAGPVTCQNKPLLPGGVANNIIPLNTRIYLEGYGQVTVNDKGSDKYFSLDNRLDVFIERKPDEDDKQYLQRVNSYGVQRVQGYIVK